jgi:hypothetical protein
MRFTKLVLLPLILAMFGLSSLAGAVAPTRAAPESPLAPDASPSLANPDNVPGQPGATVSLPVTFSSGGENVSSVVFSVDYDHTRLAFNPADNNSDGLPDAVVFDVHPVDSSKGGFSTQVIYEPGDTNGELDIAIADYATPLASLSNGVIVTVRLVVLPGPVPQTAAVNFSGSPQASFGGVSGQSIPGVTGNGSVLINAGCHDHGAPTEPPAATVSPPPPTATATRRISSCAPVPMKVYLLLAARLPVLYSISGWVVDRFNAPVSGVTISAGAVARQPRTVAAISATRPVTGTYTLTPSKTNTTFSPASRTISVPPDASGANFTAEPVLVYPPPQNCSEALSNGGFENTGAWVRSKAPYSTARFHSGARSLLTGNLELNDN